MKKIVLYIFSLILLIQLIRPTKNNTDTLSKNRIDVFYDVPDEVQDILKNACNDCHSNNTKYQWYHEVAPFSWGVALHVKDGKKHLNFDEWGKYNNYQKTAIFDDFKQVIKSGKMPMPGYVVFHPEAKLSAVARKKLRDWFAGIEKINKSTDEAL